MAFRSPLRLCCESVSRYWVRAYSPVTCWPWAASSIGVVLVSVVATLAGGIAFGRRFGLPFDIGRIAATSVTICGASAALAASAVMPNRPGLVRDTALVIVIVSLLSTAVMILYPLALGASGLAETQIALVIGAAVHDVAQVVGAGFAVSNDVGVQAVTVKMLRVACLVPVVLWLASTSHSSAADGKRPRVRLPWFLWVFVLLAAASSFGFVSADLRGVLGAGSGLLLLTSVAALGLATEARALGQAPRALVMSLFVQTIWQLTVVVSLVVAAGFALKWL